MSSINVAVIGRSHIAAMKRAQDARNAENGMRCTFVSTAPFEPLSRNGRVAELGQTLRDRVLAALRGADIAVVLVAGNQHAFGGILRQTPPLDFVLSKEPHLPLTEGAQLVPQNVLAQLFDMSMGDLRSVLEFLKSQITSSRIVVMGPPPPIESNQLIASRLDDSLAAKLSTNGLTLSEHQIASPLVRWKLWQLLQNAYEVVAKEFSVKWCPVPDAAFEGRFLSPNAIGNDATHANAWYGELRLRQLEEIVQHA